MINVLRKACRRPVYFVVVELVEVVRLWCVSRLAACATSKAHFAIRCQNHLGLVRQRVSSWLLSSLSSTAIPDLFPRSHEKRGKKCFKRLFVSVVTTIPLAGENKLT